MTPENFENHNIFDRLNSFKEILAVEDAKEKIDLEKLSFFQTVFSYINQRIKLTVPDLVQAGQLDAISNELYVGVSQINKFLGNNNSGNLTNATNNFYTAINRVNGLPITLAKTDFNFSKKIAEFEKTAINKYKSIENEKENLQGQINKIESDLDSKEKEIKRLLDLIDKKDTEIQNLSSKFKTEFENLISTHNQSFKNNQSTFRKEIDNSQEVYREEIDKLKTEIDTDTTELVDELKTKLSEAEKLVNTIGNVGVTGNYQLIANKHRASANFWRWIAIFFMAVFSFLLVWTIIDLSADGFDWTKSLIRLLAAAALSYPATYASRESSKHRRLETENRNVELELASINPFIEILDDNKKQAIKEKLVEKYFGNDNKNSLNKEVDSEGLSISALEKIINAIAKLKK